MMRKSSILYRITRHDLTKESFLLGTMHAADSDLYFAVLPALKFMDEVSHFYGEMDLGHGIAADEFEKVFRFQEGDLCLHMGIKKYTKAKKILQKALNFELDAWRQYRPFYISNMIATSFLLSDRKLPLDHWLYNNALKHNLICGGVETAQEQLATARALQADDQSAMFDDMWRNISKARRDVLQMKALYLQGDIHRLYQKSRSGLGKFRDVLQHSRNITMSERIANSVSEHACFIAIGAAHLSGEGGVIRGLKQRGYKLKPVVLK